MRNNETTLKAQGLINRNYTHTTATPQHKNYQGRLIEDKKNPEMYNICRLNGTLEFLRKINENAFKETTIVHFVVVGKVDKVLRGISQH